MHLKFAAIKVSVSVTPFAAYVEAAALNLVYFLSFLFSLSFPSAVYAASLAWTLETTALSLSSLADVHRIRQQAG